MKVVNFAGAAISKIDFFSAFTSFRVRGQPIYQTVFGGICSIIIIVAFFGLFSQNLFQTLQKNNITYTQNVYSDLSLDHSVSYIGLMLTIQGVDLTVNTGIFNITMWQHNQTINGTTFSTTSSQVNLDFCNENDWAWVPGFNAEMFKSANLNKYLCIVSGQTYNLSGYQGAPLFQYMTLQIQPCSGSTCSPTASTFISNYLATNGYFTVSMLVLNTLINPDDSTNPINYQMLFNLNGYFSSTLSTTGYVSYVPFTFQTDNSVLPWSSWSSVDGNYIDKYETHAIPAGGSSPTYVSLSFYKSNTQMSISRNLGKLDEALSYIGGLISMIIIGVGLFIGSYAQYRYELYVGHSAFSYDQTGRKLNDSDLNVLVFIGYVIYDWLNMIGLAPVKYCKRMREIDQTRQQANAQLDVRLVLKRIRHLQNISHVLISEHKEICLRLSKPATLDQSRRLRDIINYYDQFVDDLSEEEQTNLYAGQIDQSLHHKKESLLKKYPFQQKSPYEQICERGLNNEIRHEKVMKINEQFQEKMTKAIIVQALKELQSDTGPQAQKVKQKIPKGFRKKLLEKTLTSFAYDLIYNTYNRQLERMESENAIKQPSSADVRLIPQPSDGRMVPQSSDARLTPLSSDHHLNDHNQ